MLTNISLAVVITLMFATPLIFGALGGVISEKSGVVNIGIEGMMTVGAFAGATVGFYTANPWLGFLTAGIAGGILGLLHAFASITLKADQTISGVAINFIGLGISLFLCRLFFAGATMSQSVPNKIPKILSGIPNLESHPIIQMINVDATTLIALIATGIMWFVLYKTKWGLRVKAVGEKPAAADTLGVNVYKVRYICVVLSGILAGFGGAARSLAVVSLFSPTVISGHGFIALAAVIFGKWTPFGAFGACILFGFAQALVVLTGGGKVPIPSELLSMLPYVLTILVLILFVGKSVSPKANGIAYEKGKR
ncbi:MAG: ABC transporter permease [Filifactoraceae bacterium]